VPPPNAVPPPYAQSGAPSPQGGGQSGWHGAGPVTSSPPPPQPHPYGGPPPPPPVVGGYPQPYGQYSPPPAPYGHYPYGSGPYGTDPYGRHSAGGYPRPGDTNGFAIASLVCSLVGIIVIVVGPGLGILFGILGLRQLNTTRQSGRGLAIAGIVIGSIVLLLDVVGIIAAATGSGDSSGGSGVSTLHASVLLTALRISA